MKQIYLYQKNPFNDGKVYAAVPPTGSVPYISVRLYGSMEVGFYDPFSDDWLAGTGKTIMAAADALPGGTEVFELRDTEEYATLQADLLAPNDPDAVGLCRMDWRSPYNPDKIYMAHAFTTGQDYVLADMAGRYFFIPMHVNGGPLCTGGTPDECIDAALEMKAWVYQLDELDEMQEYQNSNDIPF